MMRIGIDTSVLIGILDPKDKWHRIAVDLQQTLKKRNADVAMFDCVLAEAVSTVARRMYEQSRAIEFAQVVGSLSIDYPPSRAIWILPDVPIYYDEVISLILSSQGELNFNDSLIDLSYRDRNIRYLASFDQDFDRLPWLKRIGHANELDSIPLE